jgi:putative membrane protein
MPTETDDSRLITILLIVVGAFVLFPMVFMGFGPMMGGMWGGGMWGDGTVPGWMSVVGIVIPLLFLAVLVGGGYLVYRAVTDSRADSDQALEELRLAYARGDLTEDEYEQRRAALERDADSR